MITRGFKKIQPTPIQSPQTMIKL